YTARAPSHSAMKPLLVLLAGLLLAACRPESHELPSSIALTRCRVNGIEASVLCGKYEVWENRAARTGRRITLHVAVIPARMPSHEPDPIMVLAGAPRQSAIALAPQVLPLFARLNETRDIMLIAQRGSGDSHPLDC